MQKNKTSYIFEGKILITNKNQTIQIKLSDIVVFSKILFFKCDTKQDVRKCHRFV